MRATVGRAVLELARGDITKEAADAIVNAANARLVGGLGVDGAIRRAGGSAIDYDLEQHRRKGGCPTGKAVLSVAGNLRAKAVIHAVGPVWSGGTKREPDLLLSAYRESLRLAAAKGFRSISFPSISTGIYGYPVDQAAPIALGTAVEHLKGKTPLGLVRFLFFDDATFAAYEKALAAADPGVKPAPGRGAAPGTGA